MPLVKYSHEEKLEMAKLYSRGKSLKQVAYQWGCASSTVFYAVYPDKYEAHKEYIRAMALRRGVRK